MSREVRFTNRTPFIPTDDPVRSVPTIGLFGGIPEVKSYSMERYATAVSSALRRHYGPAGRIEEFRPPHSSTLGTLTKLPIFGRLAEHWGRYPRYSRYARARRFQISHVLDHAYGHLVRVLTPGTTIVTCHDIYPLLHWRGLVRGMGRRQRPPITVQYSLSGLKDARFVVTSTESTKRDLVSFLSLSSESIHVIPYGLDAEFRPFTPGERLEAVDHLPLAGKEAKYILSVDTGSIRKNQRAVVEVLHRVLVASDLDAYLLRVGPALPAAEAARARSYGLDRRIIELGQPASNMAQIYNRCDVLLFPSLYEGFGWPVLEAMGCGLPVVASSIPPISEVANGAVLQADPLDYDDLAGSVLDLLNNDSLRRKVIAGGLKRATRFNWTEAANKLVDLHQEVLRD